MGLIYSKEQALAVLFDGKGVPAFAPDASPVQLSVGWLTPQVAGMFGVEITAASWVAVIKGTDSTSAYSVPVEVMSCHLSGTLSRDQERDYLAIQYLIGLGALHHDESVVPLDEALWTGTIV